MSSKRNHPEGLKYLFLSEMWERFGFYLLLGIFTLYLMDSQKGGLGWSSTEASDVYGTFLGLIYLTPFIGGLLADRVLGYRLSITIGGILMGTGYIMLALPGMVFFYIALFLIIMGNGFFKPNISTLLGNIYNDERYIHKKDSGYNIFYMGINVGAFICNFFAAYLRNEFGWGQAFAAAGVGMFIGVIIFWIGNKHYKGADVRKPAQEGDQSAMQVLLYIMIPAIVAGIIGYLLPVNIFGSKSTDAFMFGSIPVIIYYILLWRRATEEERKPISALLAIMGVAIIFWAVFKQNGTALTYWANYFTDRELPNVIVEPAQAIGMVQDVNYVKDSVPLYDELFRTTYEGDKVVKKFDYPYYFNNVPVDEYPKEGGRVSLVSTEIFQSINPFFVVLLTPIVVGFWGFLRRRKKEPSTPAKIAWGMLLTAVSTLIMVGAVSAASNGMEKASAWWLIGTYGVITIGELFISPMGLSLVSKLSPARFTAVMMGGWFLSTSLGIKLSGVLASMWDQYDEKQYFFLVNFGGAMLAAVGVFLMIPWLKRVMKGY